MPVELSPTDKLFSVEDIQKSSVRSNGLFYLYRSIAKQIMVENSVLLNNLSALIN